MRLSENELNTLCKPKSIIRCFSKWKVSLSFSYLDLFRVACSWRPVWVRTLNRKIEEGDTVNYLREKFTRRLVVCKIREHKLAFLGPLPIIYFLVSSCLASHIDSMASLSFETVSQPNPGWFVLGSAILRAFR